MKTFYTDAHAGHAPEQEFEGGRWTPAVEIPARAEAVLAEVRARGFGSIEPPRHFGHVPILRVHDAGFVNFLSTLTDEWRRYHGPEADVALASAWPGRGLRDVPTRTVEGQIGHYCFDTATPVLPGTWPAALAAANVALTAADALARGERAAFALTRPPGHHASGDVYGGYCFLNNAAIAAQALTDRGFRTAVLDVDYHHGNGTQTIFYKRSDVLTVSLHADPDYAYPHYLGFADERGAGAGEGFNLNLPLPLGTAWDGYAPALDAAIARVAAHRPDALVVSLGLDTYAGDPISKFKLTADDYFRMGAVIAGAGAQTLFVMEGGYAIGDLGRIAANVLEGFLQAAR